MKEFIMVFRNAPMGGFTPTPEQIQAVDKQWGDWFATIIAQGKHGGGYRPGPDGKTAKPENVVTDGPYAEVKEILMGVSVLKVETIDEALEIAKGCPILQAGGTVEVRPVIFMN
ncbi:MAG TPA: YciI family protein [Mucilaginibacter sp.]|jgi:hypothetical protein